MPSQRANVSKVEQTFSNFFPNVPPIFFGCICVPPSISRKDYYVSYTRKRNFIYTYHLQNMNSLLISTKLLQYYGNYTTIVPVHVSTHCDCNYFRYCHNEWFKHKTQRTTMSNKICRPTCTYIVINFCEQIQLSTCLQLDHLAVAIVPPVVRVPQFEKGWFNTTFQSQSACAIPAVFTQ